MLTLDPDRYDAVADQGFEDHACWPITETLLDLVQLHEGGTLLDIACGTGIVARRAASRIGPSGRAIGVDLSVGRLRHARRLADLALLQQVEFEVMDACGVTFPEDTFDAVVAQFPHLPDRAACLAGALRVLKPGGRIAIGNGGGGAPAWPLRLPPVFPGPIEAIMDGVFTDILREVVPRASEPVSRSFIQPMIQAPHQELFQAGFVDIELWSCSHTAQFSSAEDLFAFESTRNSAYRTRITEVPEQERRIFKERFLGEASTRLRRHGMLGATSGALIAAGRKSDQSGLPADLQRDRGEH